MFVFDVVTEMTFPTPVALDSLENRFELGDQSILLVETEEGTRYTLAKQNLFGGTCHCCTKNLEPWTDIVRAIHVEVGFV